MPGDDIYDDFVPDDLIAQSDAADSADENSEDWSGVSQPPAGPSTAATPDNAQSAKRKRRIKEKERKAKVYLCNAASLTSYRYSTALCRSSALPNLPLITACPRQLAQCLRV